MAETPSDDPILAALAAASSPIRRVRYRHNRSVLVSVSRDGRTLNCHECFRVAPQSVLRAIVTFAAARRRTAEHRRAVRTIQGWEGAARGLERTRRLVPARSRSGGPEPALLRSLFDECNRRHFAGALPAIPLRVSRRMSRSLGTISYSGDVGAGERGVHGIAIAANLLRAGAEEVLRETMLHEMAHAEAWLRHGRRGHCATWRAIARRVGCTPAAVVEAPLLRGVGRGRNRAARGA